MAGILTEIKTANTTELSFTLERGTGFSALINESIELPFVQVFSSTHSTDLSFILNFLPDSFITAFFFVTNVSTSCRKKNKTSELTNTTALAAGDCPTADDSSGRVLRSQVKPSGNGEEFIIAAESIVELQLRTNRLSYREI